MDDVPFFSGDKPELDSWLTCGQFISKMETISSKNNLTEVEIKEFCLSKLSDNAHELFQKNYEKSWSELKTLMFEMFPVKLTISEKVEVRKRLQQLDSESIDDFYQRCIHAQYLVSDDVRDFGFEREVLLHFLIGLSPLIRDFVLATNCTSLNNYINEAKKYIKIIKEEVPEVNIKIEVDPHYEIYDEKNFGDDLSQYDEYSNDVISNGSFKEEPMKNKKIKKPKTDNDVKKPKSLPKGWKKCEICNKDIKSQDLLLEHYEKEHRHLKQTCDICNEVCLTMKHLAIHIANKHCVKTPENKFVCYYCTNVSRPRATHLGYHILNKHFNQPLFPCPQCDKGFDRKPCLASHIRYNHVTEKLFQCDKCAKNFKTLALLKVHSKNKHEENIAVTCKICNKIFKNAKYLGMHVKNMHSVYEKAEKNRFMCDDCGKCFTMKASLIEHSLSHLSEKEKEQKKLSCPYDGCNYSNLKKALLYTHVKRVHEKKHDYQCAFCAKTFFDKGSVEEHTNGVHLNLKPYQCDKCDYATAYGSTLRDHKNVAHGNQRYDCPYCNHSARYKGNLDKHINNVHKNLQAILKESL